MIVADLHVHTTASDGLNTPEEIVRLAAIKGLSAISITDHDTVDGIGRAIRAAKQRKIEVIPGVEISTEYQDSEIHILGYYIDYGHAGLNKLLSVLSESRLARAERMVAKLKSMGYSIDLAAVLRIAGKAAPGRPHVARALMEKGYIGSVRQAFDELIGYRGPAYVERYKLSPQEAIRVIKEAGGLASWAHPGLSDDSFLEDFVIAGLEGVEAYHPEHNDEQTEHFISLARDYSLCITGGSDYHGAAAASTAEIASHGVRQNELILLKRLVCG